MKKYALTIVLSMLAINNWTALAEDEQNYLSVVPRPVLGGVKPVVKPVVSAPNKTQVKNSATPKPNDSDASSPSQESTGEIETSPGTGAEAAVPVRSFYSAGLEQAVKQYKSAPGTSAYSQVLQALKTLLASAGALRVSPAVLVKDNPFLSDFKPRIIDANGARLWNFPKSTERTRALLQWYDVHQQIVGVGRRKKVVTSSTVRFQEMSFSQPINIKDVGVLSSKENGKHLLVAGDSDDGSLSVQAFKLTESGWVESPDFLAQIPAFLSKNVCGRLGFKGSDLIYNVGKMIQVSDSSGSIRYLPEAESANYKFWLKSTESGFTVAPSVPNEDSFSAVYQFLQAVQQSKTDLEKSLLADNRLSSLPKYLGMQGKPIDASARVVEMSVPAGRGQRFRVINIGKDDLIFDVGKVKGAWQIKAIFIAQPDPFLAETAKYFPSFSHFEPKVEPTAETGQSAPTHNPGATAGGGGGNAKRK